MKHTMILALGLLPCGAGLFALTPSSSPVAAEAPLAAPEATTWKIDPVHSMVLFKINHIGASTSWGRFNDVQGSVVFDPVALEKSSVELTIKADSVDTNNEGRDKHIKGPEFFGVKEFPEITFKSKSVKKSGKHDIEVLGDLTFHGVTKPVTANVEHVGTVKHPKFGERSGFDTTLTIKRSDFGVTTYVKDKTLGDDVSIMISLEGVKS